MFQLLIPAAIILGGAALFMASKKPQAKLTPERQMLFQKIINTEKDPERLKGYAAQFRKEGLNAQADLLEKRAKLRLLPPEVKAKRRAAFKQAMSSRNKSEVMKMANLFENEGSTGAAEKLRDYAKGL